MKIIRLTYDKIPQFSNRDKAYVQEAEALRPFYKYPVSIENFEKVIQAKKDFPHRDTLVDILNEQYKNTATTQKVRDNISSLKSENTYTVITGHQPALATGPLYFICKIISTINLAEQLAEHYPDYNFVPVFWMGSEDHDFEEINHFNLFGQTFTWENDAQGAVGKMSTKNILPVLDRLKETLGDSENAQKIYDLMHRAYAQNDSLDEATFYLANELFREYGLLVFITSSREAKQLFTDFILKEIIEQPSYNIVNQTISKLEEVGFKGQASPREINFFYMREGLRERIVREGDVYKVLSTDYTFSEKEITQEVRDYPERFSPNVIMRPMYQEVLFPNLAYIGGGGELAYWLERKAQFEYFGVPFPMLIRRSSVMWIDAGQSKKINQLGLSVEDIFVEEDSLITHFVQQNTTQELDLSEAKTQLKTLYNNILAQAKNIDNSLDKSVLGEQTKALKSLDQLEQKLLRAEKRQHETATNRIKAIKSKLFPNRGLQERKDNFMAFYLKYGDDFIGTLKQEIDVLDKQMLVIIE